MPYTIKHTIATLAVLSAGLAGMAAIEAVNDLTPYVKSGDTDFWRTADHPALNVSRSASTSMYITFSGVAFRASGGSALEARHRTADDSDIVYVRRTSPRGLCFSFR